MSEEKSGWAIAQQVGQVYFQGALASAAVSRLLEKVFAQGAFWLGTNAERADVGYGEDGQRVADSLSTWAEGRAFSKQAEVRWTRRGATAAGEVQYRVWLLSEALDEASEEVRQALAMQPLGAGWRVAAGAESIYLWGQYKRDLRGWVEVRVPRVLQYPVRQEAVREQSFAGVDYVLYCAPNGAVQFTRLTGVVSRAV